MRFLMAIIVALLAIPAMAQGAPEMKAEALTSHAAYAPGDVAKVAFRFTLPDEWHVQAHKPRDPYLIPTVLDLADLPGGFSVDSFAYPEAEEFSLEFSPEPLLVFPHAFVVGASLSIDEGIAPGEYSLGGTLTYQACDDKACLAPATIPVSVDIAVANARGDAQHADVFDAIAWPETEAIDWIDHTSEDSPSFRMAVALDHVAAPAGGVVLGVIRIALDEPWHMNAHEPLDSFLIPTTITIDENEIIGSVSYYYPQGEIIQVPFQDDPLKVYAEEFDLYFKLTVSKTAAAGDISIDGSMKYQACDDTQCFPPASVEFSAPLKILSEGEPPVESNSPLVADVQTSITSDTFTYMEPAAEDEPVETDEPQAASDDWKELIDQFEVTGQASGSMSAEDFIAFIEATEAGSGNEVQSLAGQSFLAVVIAAVIGGVLLNLTPCVLPLIPINLAIIGAGAKAESRTRGVVLGGAYGVGIAAVFGGLGLLFVLGLTSFGGTLNQSPWFNLAITILFVVLGLAMFDLIVIDFSKWQAKIDTQGKGGHVGFALFMGAVSALLAGACVAPVLVAVLLYSQDQYASGNQAALVLPFLVGLGMALPWPIVGGGISMLPKPGLWMEKVKYAFGVIIIGIGAYYGYQTYTQFQQQFIDPADVVASVDAEGWHQQLGPALEEALAEDKPVLIDFWAKWCKNCLYMNKTTLVDEDVIAALDGYVKVKYRAEVPGDPPHADLLARFDQYVSFPFYVIIEPKN